MKIISRNSPFGAVAAPWYDMIASPLLSIIHPNYRIYINLSPKTVSGIPPFGP